MPTAVCPRRCIGHPPAGPHLGAGSVPAGRASRPLCFVATKRSASHLSPGKAPSSPASPGSPPRGLRSLSPSLCPCTFTLIPSGRQKALAVLRDPWPCERHSARQPLQDTPPGSGLPTPTPPRIHAGSDPQGPTSHLLEIAFQVPPSLLLLLPDLELKSAVIPLLPFLAVLEDRYAGVSRGGERLVGSRR